jgi:hypothetical protein
MNLSARVRYFFCLVDGEASAVTSPNPTGTAVQFLPWAEKNRQFRAVNKVIARDGFKVVTLLRLSPLLPLSASNYLYGLTSVSLSDYFFGSWLGMVPGTVAYVSAGHVSAAAFMGGEVTFAWWQLIAAAMLSLAVIAYIGSLAQQALLEMEEEEAGVARGSSTSLPDVSLPQTESADELCSAAQSNSTQPPLQE